MAPDLHSSTMGMVLNENSDELFSIHVWFTTPPQPVNLLLCPSVGGGQQVQSRSQQASGHQAQRQPSFHSRCGLYSALLTTSSHRHYCRCATTQLLATKRMLLIQSKMHYDVIFFFFFWDLTRMTASQWLFLLASVKLAFISTSVLTYKMHWLSESVVTWFNNNHPQLHINTLKVQRGVDTSDIDVTGKKLQILTRELFTQTFNPAVCVHFFFSYLTH